MLRDYQLATRLSPPPTARQELNTRAVIEGKETPIHTLRPPRRRFKREAAKFEPRPASQLEMYFFLILLCDEAVNAYVMQ
jgi:hypothetical protein